MKKILYLYTEIMGYQMPILENLSKHYSCEVHVVHVTKNKESKYEIPILPNVKFYKKEDFSFTNLKSFCLNLSPDLVYVSGWMEWDYTKIIYELRKQHTKVVTGFDDIWHNTFRQRIGRMIFPLIKRRLFSHAWVAGPYQYEYAKKLGFSNDEIIFNCLSADTKLFGSLFENNYSIKEKNYPKNFYYVGRFNEVKGVDLLLKAWQLLRDNRKDWKLFLIGNGAMNFSNSNIEDVEIIDFLQPEKLLELTKTIGCLIIPSRKEQWSVAMHEFSINGVPIICSDICGALPLFVISNYNGFTFKSKDILDLSNKMKKIIDLREEELLLFSRNSNSLGKRITSEMAASSFISVIE